jgi:hypothetical protein
VAVEALLVEAEGSFAVAVEGQVGDELHVGSLGGDRVRLVCGCVVSRRLCHAENCDSSTVGGCGTAFQGRARRAMSRVQKISDTDTVTEGSGNVFADLGL